MSSEPHVTEAMAIIRLGSRTGRSYADIDAEVFATIPGITTEALAAAYRAVAREHQEEADELERFRIAKFGNKR
jgi:hypothetical protein